MYSRLVACRFFLTFGILSFAFCSLVSAQQLRIETSVFVDDEAEPVSETVTLFDSTTVYHFVEHPQQETVYRAPGASREGQFIILDVQNKKRTDISTKRIAGLMEKLTLWAGEQEDVMLKFSAQPMFEESYDEEKGILELENPAWTYTVATVPAEDDQALAKYREFADWYCRLNAMLHSTPPPGARLELNKVLAERSIVPVEIRRKIQSQDEKLRATHLFTWRLSREDRQRIDKTQKRLTNFEKVDNADFIALLKQDDTVRGQSK